MLAKPHPLVACTVLIIIISIKLRSLLGRVAKNGACRRRTVGLFVIVANPLTLEDPPLTRGNPRLFAKLLRALT